MDDETRDLIRRSTEAIEKLEKHIKDEKMMKWCRLVFSCLSGGTGVYLIIVSGSMIWLAVNMFLCALYLFSFFQKRKAIEGAEALLENAKFNESFLKSTLYDEGDEWQAV